MLNKFDISFQYYVMQNIKDYLRFILNTIKVEMFRPAGDYMSFYTIT